MAMVTEYPPIRIVSPAGFDAGTAQAPGSVRLAAEPIPESITMESSRQSPMSCQVSAKSVGARGGRIRCARESRRFHPCACLPTAHGNPSVGFGAFSLGGREEHVNADRGEPSGPYVATAETCSRGRASIPFIVSKRSEGQLDGIGNSHEAK